jgi:O-antigen ligase
MEIHGIFIAGIIILLSVSVLILIKKEYHLPVIILLLLLLVSDINPVIRTSVNIFSFIYLGWQFLLQYDLNLSKYPRVPYKLGLFLLLYFCSLMISTVFSVNISNSIVQFGRVIIFFGFIYLIYSQLKSVDSIRLIFASVITACTITSLVVLYNFFTNPGQVFDFDQNILHRIPGLYSNVNALGGLYIVSVITLISLLIFGVFNRKILSLLLVLNIIALIVNNSRSAILGILIGTIFIFYKFKPKYLYILLASAAVLVLIIGLNDQLTRMFDFYFRIERTISSRDIFWEMGADMFRNNILLGVGPAGYKFEMYNYLPVALGSWDELNIQNYYNITDFGLQHNFYLFVLSELGLIGFAVLSYFFFLFFQKSFGLINNSSVEYRLISIIAIATAIGLLSRGFFESLNILSYGWLSGDLPFWLVTISLFSIEKVSNSTQVIVPGYQYQIRDF